MIHDYPFLLPLMIPIVLVSMGITAWALNQIYWRRKIEPLLRRLVYLIEKGQR